IAYLIEQGRLYPGEREVEARHLGDRKRKGLRVALPRKPVEGGAPRIAQAEQARALVERLPGGVVERRSDDAEAGTAAHIEQHRVSAGREEAEKGRLGLAGLEVERRNVPAKVVDRDEGKAVRPSQGLGRAEPDQQRPDQPRALSDRD